MVKGEKPLSAFYAMLTKRSPHTSSAAEFEVLGAGRNPETLKIPRPSHQERSSACGERRQQRARARSSAGRGGGRLRLAGGCHNSRQHRPHGLLDKRLVCTRVDEGEVAAIAHGLGGPDDGAVVGDGEVGEGNEGGEVGGGGAVAAWCGRSTGDTGGIGQRFLEDSVGGGVRVFTSQVECSNQCVRLCVCYTCA